jgi:hypothetical protein
MYTLLALVRMTETTSKQINGLWVPARPLIRGWHHRLRDAWRVLIGRYDAVKWPEGQ